jgi:AraC-like DNA-binding protein
MNWTGGATLKEAAFRVGYNHVTKFISAFRARYGAPPVRFIGRRAPMRARRRRLTAG